MRANELKRLTVSDVSNRQNLRIVTGQPIGQETYRRMGDCSEDSIFC